MGALADARSAIMAVVQQIKNDFHAYSLTIDAENQESIDQSEQQKPYLKVEIKPIGGGQVSLGVDPLAEQRGQIIIYACIKVGQGTQGAEALRDFVTPYFDRKVLNGVHCSMCVAVREKEVLGWLYYPLIVNYYYHRQAV